MDFDPIAYVWLGGSIVGAVFVDFFFVRIFQHFVRPPSVYMFLAARLGKLAGLVAWIAVFNSSIYSAFRPGEGIPEWVRMTELGAVSLLVLFALASFPRGGRRRTSGHA